MRLRVLTTSVTIGLAASVSLTMSEPAHAASTTVTLSCLSMTQSDLSPNGFSAGPGDSISVFNSTAQPALVSLLNGMSGASTIGAGATQVYTVTSSSGGSGRFMPQVPVACGGRTVNLVFSAGAGSGAVDASPTPVIQQFGMPSRGTCDAAQPEGLNWAGVASGGWAATWGEWMHGGKGGPVCSRTLMFSISQAKWIVS